MDSLAHTAVLEQARPGLPDILHTPKTRLVPGTKRSLALLLEDPRAFATRLNVDCAHDWDGLEFEDWGPYVLRDMKDDPEEVGWWLWWLIQTAQSTPQGRDRFVGYLGFKGPPSAGGNVELMYGLAPSGRRQGLLFEALGGLLRWVSRTRRVKKVFATVSPDNSASLRALQHHGFSRRDDESDDEEWVLSLELLR